jgi:hypothetical protein
MFIIKYLPRTISVKLDQIGFKILRMGFIGAVKHTNKNKKYNKKRHKKSQTK